MPSFPKARLSASNAAVLSSGYVLLPVCIRCEAKVPAAALKKVSEIVTALRDHASTKEEWIEFVPFEEAISPRLARFDITKKGKEMSFAVTVAIRARFPQATDFWARVSFVASCYEELTTFALAYDDAKGVDIFLEEARLETQKEEPDRVRFYRK